MSKLDPLAAAMRRLPEPAPPSTLEATVMAHIARLPAPAPASSASHEPARSRRDLASWVWAVAGLLLVIGLNAYDAIVSGALPELGALRLAPGGPNALPSDGLTLSLLVLGLFLSAAGLFSQVSGRRSAHQRRRL